MSDTVWDLNQRRQDLLEFLFKEMSSKKVISTPKSWVAFIIAIVAAIIVYIVMFRNSLSSVSPSRYAWIIPLSGLTITVLCFVTQSFMLRNNIRKKYNKPTVAYDWTANYANFLHCYRADKLKEELSRFKIAPSNIDDEILYYESVYQNSRQIIWRNIGIVGITTLPLWTELVGKEIDLEGSVLLILALVSFYLAATLIFISYLIDNLLLVRVAKYKRAAAILRDVKQVQ